MADKDCTQELTDSLDSYRQQWLSCIKLAAYTWKECTDAYWELAAEAYITYLLCLAANDQISTLTPERRCYLQLMYTLSLIAKDYKACLAAGLFSADRCYAESKAAIKAAWDTWRKCLQKNGKPVPILSPEVIRNPYAFPPMTKPEDIIVIPVRPGTPIMVPIFNGSPAKGPPTINDILAPKPQGNGVSVIYPLDVHLQNLINALGGPGGLNLAGFGSGSKSPGK